MTIQGKLQDLVDVLETVTSIAGPPGATGNTGNTGNTGQTGAGVTALAHGKLSSGGALAAGANGVGSASKIGTGQYQINLSPAMANTNYKVLTTGDAADGQNPRYTINSASQFEVSAFADTAFSFLVIP